MTRTMSAVRSSDQERAGTRRTRARWLALALVALAVGLAAASLLGPVGLGWMRYRTSVTTRNQLLGSDAAALLVVAPLALVAAALAARGHRAAPPLAIGIGGYALYTYAQVIVGQEYLRLPGNVERFFPLLLTIFLLAELVVLLAWRAWEAGPPALPVRLERVAGVALLAVAAFLVVGLHLPTMRTAWRDPASLVEYASSPTPFWLVKLMDLGIVVPLAVAAGVGLLRHADGARRIAYPLLTGYTCLAISVAAMALVMLANADPGASVGLTVGFALFALVFLILTSWLYRSLAGQPAPDARPVRRRPA